MATTKSRPTSSRAKKSTTPRTRTTAKSTPKSDNVVARAGRTVRDRPYASAAIATGAVTAVAAAAAGAFFFSRKDKSLRETASDLGDRLSDVGERIKDGIDEARGKASAFFDRPKTQREIAEEAETLKATGELLDEQNQQGIKAGSVSY